MCVAIAHLRVDGKQHVREGSAEVGAVDVLVPGCPREKDVVAARAVKLDRRFGRQVGEPDRQAGLPVAVHPWAHPKVGILVLLQHPPEPTVGQDVPSA